jgi:hypothetical protein
VFWANRWGWKKVLFVSVGCWVISQFRVREMLLASLKDDSFLNPGPFDLLSWQLLWVGGLIFGKCVQENRPILQLSIRAESILLILAMVFLALRWYTIALQIDLGKQLWILDKWHLGPLRVMNFFVTTWSSRSYFRHCNAGKFRFDHSALSDATCSRSSAARSVYLFCW